LQGEATHQLIIREQQQHYVVELQGQQLCCQAVLKGDELSATLGDHKTKVRVSRYQDTISVFIKHHRYDFIYRTEVTPELDGSEHAGSLTAPMNGTIVAVITKAGAMVKVGDTLIIMEAMKMEYSIKAPKNGVINAVFYAAGDLVKDGAELVDFSPEEA
jgi:3-methylcrotonyl-CoA carboxylase alpha subunit